MISLYEVPVAGTGSGIFGEAGRFETDIGWYVRHNTSNVSRPKLLLERIVSTAVKQNP